MFDVNGCEYVFRGLVPAHNLASQCLGGYNTLNASDCLAIKDTGITGAVL